VIKLEKFQRGKTYIYMRDRHFTTGQRPVQPAVGDPALAGVLD